MTQEEFDGLDDTRTGDARGDSSADSRGNFLGALKAQGPLRLAAAGFGVVAAGILAGAIFLGTEPVQVSDGRIIPPRSQADPVALSVLPRPSSTMARLRPAPIGGALPLHQTPAVADPVPPSTRPAATAVPVDKSQASVAVADCAVEATAAAKAGAIIALQISAPCDAGSRVDIFQGDLQTAVLLDADGGADLELPALSAAATVAVVVDGGVPISLLANVRDIGTYNRAVLFWQGSMGLEMHAFEDGSLTYGSEAHVSPATARSAAYALSGKGGYMTMVGDADLEQARVALVYTSPADQAATISIEAPVLAETCGQEVFAGTIFIPADDAPQTQSLTLTLPSCEAEGDFVLLGNLMAFRPSIDLASN